MSTDYGLYCDDCKNALFFGYEDVSQKSATYALEHIEDIVKAFAIQPNLQWPVELEMSIDGHTFFNDRNWFTNHAGHHLRVISEGEDVEIIYDDFQREERARWLTEEDQKKEPVLPTKPKWYVRFIKALFYLFAGLLYSLITTVIVMYEDRYL